MNDLLVSLEIIELIACCLFGLVIPIAILFTRFERNIAENHVGTTMRILKNYVDKNLTGDTNENN